MNRETNNSQQLPSEPEGTKDITLNNENQIALSEVKEYNLVSCDIEKISESSHISVNKNFEGIVFGKNWYLVRYGTNVRYVQHSSIENLEEYYKRLDKYYNQVIPDEIITL